MIIINYLIFPKQIENRIAEYLLIYDKIRFHQKNYFYSDHVEPELNADQEF